jgi:non-heme chloroperoxidase
MSATNDAEQVQRANDTDLTPVVFVHGLWLLPNSWERWGARFQESGYAPVLLGWPDDPETVAEAKQHPEVFANKTVGEVADYTQGLIGQLTKKPAIIGHSFGGLLAEILAGRGLAFASVAISPAPFRGVLPLPISSLRSAAPALENPANYHRAIPLTYDQFRYSFANAVDEDQAKRLYEQFSVATPAAPLFQAASANLNPWTEVKVNSKNPDRGAMLLIGGGRDHTVPWSITNASYKKQRRNPGMTEIVKFDSRGHAMTIDDGWQEVCDTAIRFISQFGS